MIVVHIHVKHLIYTVLHQYLLFPSVRNSSDILLEHLVGEASPKLVKDFFFLMENSFYLCRYLVPQYITNDIFIIIDYRELTIFHV